MSCVIAVDAGTTGVRSLAVDPAGAVMDLSYREVTQHFPRPGWVEHDAGEIWQRVGDTLVELTGRLAQAGHRVSAIGITNQRETVIAWDRRTGLPRHRAIVWQDRRTTDACEALRHQGHLDVVRTRTGLVLDPYFSATKMSWLLEHGDVAADDHLVLGTVDTWLAWNLTGGPDGGVLATDPTNASRTLLYDINERRWSEELCSLFGVPSAALPTVQPSCGRVGVVGGDLGTTGSPLCGVPVSGMAGDQQAALFGQACFDPGMAKATYGTGSFILMNVGDSPPAPVEGLLTTIAWDLGSHATSPVTYALEGAVFATGAAIQWLRDGIGVIGDSSEVGPLAQSVPSSEGVVFVPAFTGLGSPWWDPHARGTITGLSRGLGAAHIARAVVESIAFQVRDVADAMRDSAGRPLTALRVDGGAAVMDSLLQMQADQLRVLVERPTSTETTALGAATLAGLAEGVWGSVDDLAARWTTEAVFEPKASQVSADEAHAGWQRALQHSRNWAHVESE